MTDIPGTITVTVPFTIRHHGGRKQVITQDGRPALAPPRARVDSALVKALGRAFRWRRLLDTGAYATIEEIATAEGINPSYVSRVLCMTLLAPALVEAALAGRPPEGMTLVWAMGRGRGSGRGRGGRAGANGANRQALSPDCLGTTEPVHAGDHTPGPRFGRFCARRPRIRLRIDI